MSQFLSSLQSHFNDVKKSVCFYKIIKSMVAHKCVWMGISTQEKKIKLL